MCSCTDRIAAADSSSRRPQSNSAQLGEHLGGHRHRPVGAEPGHQLATAAPSRSEHSNRQAPRLELTWMSIDGDVVGTTSVMAMVPVLKKRVDVVAVDATNQPLDREAHALGHPSGEDVAEVAGRHDETDRSPSGATARCAVT